MNEMSREYQKGLENSFNVVNWIWFSVVMGCFIWFVFAWNSHYEVPIVIFFGFSVWSSIYKVHLRRKWQKRYERDFRNSQGFFNLLEQIEALFSLIYESLSHQWESAGLEPTDFSFEFGGYKADVERNFEIARNLLQAGEVLNEGRRIDILMRLWGSAGDSKFLVLWLKSYKDFLYIENISSEEFERLFENFEDSYLSLQELCTKEFCDIDVIYSKSGMCEIPPRYLRGIRNFLVNFQASMKKEFKKLENQKGED